MPNKQLLHLVFGRLDLLRSRRKFRHREIGFRLGQARRPYRSDIARRPHVSRVHADRQAAAVGRCFGRMGWLSSGGPKG